MAFHKDESLNRLAEIGNVAQFVSFGPGGNENLVQRFCRISNRAPNEPFESPRAALEALLTSSVDGSINLRCYTPESPRSHAFHYGIRQLDQAIDLARNLAADGLFVITNETVDVSDGGVSGVLHGEVIEFAPDDTPRCVEKPGVVSISCARGIDLLTKVYGFVPELVQTRTGRLEFSVHPVRRGWKQSQTLLWEYEDSSAFPVHAALAWPNRFSRIIGDKAFGLLIADGLGLPVPKTTVIGRRVAPFSFGRPTGNAEWWTRTCPAEPDPGRFTTTKGWIDPFRLLASEDPDGLAITSVLSQAAVNPEYSGAAIVLADGTLAIEGRPGKGDRLMLGQDKPANLPPRVIEDVRAHYTLMSSAMGAVRFEWVHDGHQAWIVQLHVGQTLSSASQLVPGDPEHWVEFDATLGLEALRAELTRLPAGAGLRLLGFVGLTSHIADLIRKANRPARLVAQD